MSGTVRVVALALWCGIALLLPELATRLLPGAPVTPHRQAVSTSVRLPARGLDGLRPMPLSRREIDAPRRLDLRGNEIVRPVAWYQLDRRGTLYEVHSPETELPRLKPPRS